MNKPLHLLTGLILLNLLFYTPNLYNISGIKKGFTNVINLPISFLLILILKLLTLGLDIRLFKVALIQNFEYKAVINSPCSSLVKLSVHNITVP